MRQTILEKVRRTIRAHGMLDHGDRVIAAVSGGPDSVCLVHILHRLSDEFGISLVVAHFNHGLRPGEDERETALVRAIAQSLHLAFETEASPTLREVRTSSIEELARDARYAFLEGVREKHGARKIAVGHHLNDQAETFLMRLLRGSGASGLAGIPPIRQGKIIRPLIDLTRTEIEDYLDENRLPFAIDSSNLRHGHLRNRIRLDLLPALLQYQPRLVQRLGETAATLREESEYLDAVAREWIEREGGRTPEGDLFISRTAFLQLPAAISRRVTRLLLLEVKGNIRRIGHTHIRAVHELAVSDKAQTSLSLPNRLTVRRAYDRLTFTLRKDERPGAFSYPLRGPGTLLIAEIGQWLTLEVMERDEGVVQAPSPTTAYLDADLIPFPLEIRNFRPGDRFIPLGMKGHKKIKDFFIDQKVPLRVRRSTPILCFEDQPVWLCGFRIDDRFKVTSSTTRTLRAFLHA